MAKKIEGKPDLKRTYDNCFVHPSAEVDDGAVIGNGTVIWHFSHIMGSAVIGTECSLGQNVFIGNQVKIGKGVKIQNNVSLYEGVICEDDVFLGPSCVFTNVVNPRSRVSRKSEFKTTAVGRGATIGANATIVCGISIGKYAFIGAGAVVTKDVPDFALMVGNPARRTGWMSRMGIKLSFDNHGFSVCPESGSRYNLIDGTVKEL